MLLVKRALSCILAVGLGLLVGASLAAAQVPPLVGRGPYAPGLVGIPSGPQVIDVRWSGDRRGEFTEIGVLPPAFRGPTPAPVLGPILAPVPAPSPTPAPIPTIVLPRP